MASIHRGPALQPRTAPNQLVATRTLRNGALLLLAAFLLHNGDHLRRGIGVLTPEVFWAGTVTGLMTLAAIVLVLRGHRLGPPVAVAVGCGMVLGVSVVHLLPRWSVLSDSLPDGGVDAFTWMAVLCEIAGGLAFGCAGLQAMRSVARRQREDQPAPSRRA